MHSRENMKNNPLWYLQTLEQKAIDAIAQCSGYECVEYDNGTFECDKCPIYRKYIGLSKKAERAIRGENK